MKRQQTKTFLKMVFIKLVQRSADTTGLTVHGKVASGLYSIDLTQ